MQDIGKIRRAVSEETVLPTNQPTNHLLPTTLILRTSLTPVQKNNQEQMTMRKDFEVSI